jgi:DNA replication protein DnaC
MTDCARRRPTRREIAAACQELRRYGMAGAWVDLTSQGNVGIESSRWLVEHLRQAEHPDRAMRAVSYQRKSARFPVHRDLTGFDCSHAKVDERLILALADLAFTEVAHNVVFIGGTGTGKSPLATALGVSGITRHGRRVRCFSTVDLVNALEQEKAAGKAGKLALSLMRVDLVILDE